jgi:hypothetical protein
MTDSNKWWMRYWTELKPCHQCLKHEHIDLMGGTILMCHYCDFGIRSKANGEQEAATRLKTKWNALYYEKTTKLQRLLAGQE